MLSLYNRLTDTSNYIQSSEVIRARIVYTMLTVTSLLFTIYAIFVPFRTRQQLNDYHTYIYRALRPLEYPVYTLGFLGFYIIGIITYLGVRRGFLRRVLFGPSLMIYFGTVIAAAQNNMAYSQNILLLLIPLVIAALLDGERGLQIFTPIHFVISIGSYGYYIGQDAQNTLSNLITMTIGSFTIIFFIYLYLRINRLDRTETAIIANRRRMQIAQLTTQITRGIAESENQTETLQRIVEEISKSFPEAYHVQVFLIDTSGRIAQLTASTGRVGQKLLERNHSLPVGSVSVIGQVTQRQQAIRAEVGGQSSVHRPNELLPETRLEVAFPLNIGNRNIGALDLQAKSPDALEDEDIIALQAIADSIAIAIDNSRLIEQSQARVKENQQLIERMAAAQHQVEMLNRELTGTIWLDYLKKQEINIDFNFENNAIQSADDLTEAIMDAIQRDDIVRHAQGDKYIVAIPLRVRGEVIGAIEFEVDEELSAADIEMLNEVSERFGLAAENNRLYEESQRLAQREALVNEISSRIQSSSSVNATLSEAAKSLRDALKAKRVDIRLGVPSQTKREQSGDHVG